jgi:uncharacterized protein (TIGR00299 family) protein
MILAALLDAGADPERLRSVPGQLALDRVEIAVTEVERQGIGALHVDVRAPADPGERDWRAIRDLLEASSLEPPVRDRSLAVFTSLAEAEAAVHRTAVEDVHFHELGAVDTLVDVCGAVTLLADLELARLTCSPLPVARGLTPAAHGVLPLPSPATLELLRGAPVYGVEPGGELVTPTGAAIVSTLADRWGPLPPLTLDRVGYGAGSADPPGRPNVVRVLIGTPAEAATGLVSVLETNLDDLVPELVPDAVERCFEAGALDVWTTPVQMKKGRPGVVLSALARPDAEQSVAAAMLEETSALGVRVARVGRYELERELRTVEVRSRAGRCA